MIALSLLIWALDSLATYIFTTFFNRHRRNQYGTRSPRYSTTGKDILDGVSGMQSTEEDRSHHSSHFLFKSAKLPQSSRKRCFRFRLDFSSLHFSVLQGNLVRILMLFHLPVTIFSSYELTLGRGNGSVLRIALAALSLIIVSIVIPILLIFRLFITSTSKLYDETWTLLALGPLYNHYRHGSQLFACIFFATSLSLGITIGCGQKSGTAQAIIILIIEVISALVTSVWLPWGHGASMGLISFLFCVARIVVAVLLVILTPPASISLLHLASTPDQCYSCCPGGSRARSRPMGDLCDFAHYMPCLPGSRSFIGQQDY
jgi:Transient receptor potential (TRP) ion channel